MKPKSLLSGLLAGAAIGLFFAPKTGKEVRTSMKKDIKKGNFGLSTLKDTFLQMGKEIGDYCSECLPEDKINKAKKTIKKTIKKTEKKAKDVIIDTENKAKKTIKKVKKVATKKINNLAN